MTDSAAGVDAEVARLARRWWWPFFYLAPPLVLLVLVALVLWAVD